MFILLAKLTYGLLLVLEHIVLDLSNKSDSGVRITQFILVIFVEALMGLVRYR
jgi:hypothetical protein